MTTRAAEPVTHEALGRRLDAHRAARAAAAVERDRLAAELLELVELGQQLGLSKAHVARAAGVTRQAVKKEQS